MIEIEHFERLTALFGHWPSFHDAALTALRLDATGVDGPSLEADLDVFETLPEVDERGYFRLSQRARTTLRFGRVARLELGNFADQNALFDLELAPAEPGEHDPYWGPEYGTRRFRVRWPSGVGCEAAFLCDSVAVVAAEAVALAP